MKKKILITGSSGHSGAWISRLLAADYDLLGADLVAGPYTTQRGSLADKDFVHRITRGVYAVIHTASLHAPHIATHDRRAFVDTNIIGTLNLLEASREHGVGKFIYTSTTSLYGESMDDTSRAVWITEEVPTLPRDIYDITKIAAEGLCRDFFHTRGLQTTVLRVSRFWDEPMPDKLFYRMYRGVDVRDVARAHRLALEQDFQAFDLFNISAQSIFTKQDLRQLKHDAGSLLRDRIPELVRYYQDQGWPIPDSIDRVYVIDKAREKLGYSPRYNVQALLEEQMKASG